MAGNDTFPYHVKNTLIEQKSRAVASLITQERTQKLELLIHLLSNSRQPLVVCGPEGIGKTKFLNVLQQYQIEPWLYCFVQGNADLNFEEVQERTAQVLKQGKTNRPVQKLPGVFTRLENRHKKKVVLIIDDAGYLAPGLLNTIIEYAAANAFLSVIFVLTNDDLYVKYKSDGAIDDCNFIEISPLSERQCGEFLQHLAVQPNHPVSLNVVNDEMIENIYRETEGIPGKIIAQLTGAVAPEQAAEQKSENSLPILVGAVAGLVIIALGIQWYSASDYNKKAILTSSAPIEQSVSFSPVVSEQFVGEVIEHLTGAGAGKIINNEPKASQAAFDEALCNQQRLGDAQQEIFEFLVVAGKPDDDRSINNASLSEPEKPEIKERGQIEPVIKEQAEGAENQDNGKQWLKAQADDSYTLQLMVLSKEQSAKDVLKKHPLLKDNLRYFKSIVNGKEKFVLLYGTFTSFALAKKAKKSLPSEFRNSVARKISAIKNK
ncbi:MAG: ATP-binding protein [Methylococcales bacterium]|nr:ATP-binding protein [Methylococcales bacterium]